MFTARCGLIPYIKQITFVFKRITIRQYENFMLGHHLEGDLCQHIIKTERTC